MRLESGERVVQVMLVVHIAQSAEVDVRTDQTLPSHASDAVLLASIADNIVVTDTDGRVVDHSQVVCILVTDSVISSRSGVPLNDNSFVWSSVRTRSTHFDHCSAMTFAII